MTTFGFYQDAPYGIETEGREITLKFTKTSPTTGRVSWTLPKGAPGCSVEDLTYNGIVIVVDNVPIRLEQTPSNQTYYTADPTVDRNLHAGDKIGTALVVGAFYDDKKTTTLEVSGLQPNIPYYFAGFAVDNVGNYHREGVHSYSQEYQEKGEPDEPACQVVELGVLSTDSTYLNPTQTYSFNIEINGVEHEITIQGSAAQTYQDLITVLNYKLATIENPFQGPNAPGTGTIYINQTTKQVFVWDGFKHILQNAITNNNIPNTPTNGDYWVDNQQQKLYKWNGSSWVEQTVITFKTDPRVLECGTYWFNGTAGFQWDGQVWKPVKTYVQPTDPSKPPTLPCGMYWLNSKNNSMYRWKAINKSCVEGENVVGEWQQVNVLVWDDDPRLIPEGTYWYNFTTNDLLIRDVNRWKTPNVQVVKTTSTPSSSYAVGTLWFNPQTETLYIWNGNSWVQQTNLIVWDKDPTTPSPGDLYFDEELFVWDVVGQQWKNVSYIETENDPSAPQTIVKNSLWINDNQAKQWDGTQWVGCNIIMYNIDPTRLPNDTLWHDTTANQWKILTNGQWVQLTYTEFTSDPTILNSGQYWYNPSSNSLFVWNGITWIPLVFQTIPVNNVDGLLWYNTTDKTLYQWDKNLWKEVKTTNVALDEKGHLLFKTGTVGSSSTIKITDKPAPNGLFISLKPVGKIQPAKKGTDGLLPTPSYLQLGVGTDGSSEERREMVEAILLQFGYPNVQVELTKQQLEFCINQGIQTLRRAGSAGYERVLFFLNLKAGQQHYKLTDKSVGFHKIVNIMGIHRMTSAFLGTAEGQGVYGQLILQHLYQMGTFDLVSYHIISDYIELMEKLFAANIMFSWKEKTRTLSIHQNLWRDERVLVDAVIERTEQDILADRYLNNWVQNWATAEACMILAETRGKYSSLPGAGGGISLNAGDLRMRAERMFQQCMDELDNYIAESSVESLGMNTQFIMG